MSRLNIREAIKKGGQLAADNDRYNMSYDAMLYIKNNSEGPFEMIRQAFLLGFTQGTKASKKH